MGCSLEGRPPDPTTLSVCFIPTARAQVCSSVRLVPDTLPNSFLQQVKASGPLLFEEDHAASAWQEPTRLQICPVCVLQLNTQHQKVHNRYGGVPGRLGEEKGLDARGLPEATLCPVGWWWWWREGRSQCWRRVEVAAMCQGV